MESSDVKSALVKNAFTALSVLFLGYTLLLLAFVFDHALQYVVSVVFKAVFNYDPNTQFLWFPQVMHIVFIFVVSYLSVLVLGSKLSTMYKAAYSMIPFSLIYVTFYIFYFPWPDFVYFVSILFYISVFYLFLKMRTNWIYYFSFTLVSISLYILSLNILST